MWSPGICPSHCGEVMHSRVQLSPASLQVRLWPKNWWILSAAQAWLPSTNSGQLSFVEFPEFHSWTMQARFRDLSFFIFCCLRLGAFKLRALRCQMPGLVIGPWEKCQTDWLVWLSGPGGDGGRVSSRATLPALHQAVQQAIPSRVEPVRRSTRRGVSGHQQIHQTHVLVENHFSCVSKNLRKFVWQAASASEWIEYTAVRR